MTGALRLLQSSLLFTGGQANEPETAEQSSLLNTAGDPNKPEDVKEDPKKPEDVEEHPDINRKTWVEGNGRCPPDNWKLCKSGQCVDSDVYKRCDGKDDCLDASDEACDCKEYGEKACKINNARCEYIEADVDTTRKKRYNFWRQERLDKVITTVIKAAECKARSKQAFKKSDDDKNSCPSGFRILSKSECRVAARQFGPFEGTVIVGNKYPRGCYVTVDTESYKNGGVYFNNDAEGSVSSGRHVICANINNSFTVNSGTENSCPNGYRSLVESECADAVGQFSYNYGGSWTSVNFPRGCYGSKSSNTVYFNNHAVGHEHSGRHVICFPEGGTAQSTLKEQGIKSHTLI